MTRYAVGDLQGCLKPLLCLLEQVDFNPSKDQLWLVGDLINRGPDSLETLRYIKQLDTCTRIVLGNHDLHFLAIVYGATTSNKTDTLEPVLNAPDCDQLAQWLRHLPLLYTDPSGDYTMTHAGIPPIWSLQQAQTYAAEVEAVLRSDQIQDYFSAMYGDQPSCWSLSLTGWGRIRLITNYLTRMRFCTADGTLDLTNKGAILPDNTYAPWFSHPKRQTKHKQLLFGHWAALQGQIDEPNIYGLDTGCVWGGAMTMMNLENKTIYSCDCSQ